MFRDLRKKIIRQYVVKMILDVIKVLGMICRIGEEGANNWVAGDACTGWPVDAATSALRELDFSCVYSYGGDKSYSPPVDEPITATLMA